MARKLFLSHRHADKAIADVVRKHLGYWNFPDEDIFQSSVAGRGTKIGEPLVGRLKDAIGQSSLVILLYTFVDEDWSYPMWEHSCPN